MIATTCRRVAVPSILTVLVLVLVLLLSACATVSDDPSAGEPGPVVDGGFPSLPTPRGRLREGGGNSTSYLASVRRIDPELRARMRSSHGPGCPVRWRDLRYLRITYVGFDERRHSGEMVVHEDYADEVTRVFGLLYRARWPIYRMRLVDDFNGDDDRSMAANNTSGYNCRRVAGSNAWSKHAYGTAIDLNPLQNPYVAGSSIAPPRGRRFAAIDRSPGARVPAGAICADSVAVRAFGRIGWDWGGEWSTTKDYQHFSATGR